MSKEISPEFNAGFWCAVQEFCSEGSLRRVLKLAGFSRDEYNKLLQDNDYIKDKLLPVVVDVLDESCVKRDFDESDKGCGLCRCVMCDIVMVDCDMGVDSIKYKTDNTVHEMDFLDDSGSWVCPLCGSNDYLKRL